ncbi:MAG: hypothetical protein Fur0041_18950 [Bacteroidia bacterium]
MKQYIISIFIILSLFSGSCKKENLCDCFKGTGSVTSETRALPDFSNVYAEDNVNVIFIEDTFSSVEVEAGENLLKLIKTEVADGWLKIRNDNKCNFVRRYDIPVNVIIHYKRNTIYHIKSKCTGTLYNQGVSTSDSLDLDVESSGDIRFSVASGKIFTHQHGTGDVELKGQCNDVIIYSIGTGFTLADECLANYVWVYTNTTGKITVHTSGILDAEIDGSGNVYYKGTPTQIFRKLHGTGQVLPY